MAGSHLAEYLLFQERVEVYGICRWRSRMENLEDLEAKGRLNRRGLEANLIDHDSLRELAESDKVNLIRGDLTDASSMRHLIRIVRPDRIFHLAAQSYVPASWNAPAQTFTTNVIGQLNLLEAVREEGGDPLIHIAGSSEEYGLVLPDEVPITESNPLRPLSPYAVSKVTQELLALQYHRSYGFKTVITRGFNHEGPRRGEVFSTSSFAKQIAEIEKGMREPIINVGDLSCKRDWTDVRDFVRAYWLALEKGVPGEVYNVGSGVTRTVQSMLDLLLSMSSISIEVRTDPTRMRPSDVRILWSNSDKFKAQTGWEPKIPFEQTLRDLLDYWRERV